jgi:pimeloyl-ACP methyl ester carboxylesterase
LFFYDRLGVGKSSVFVPASNIASLAKFDISRRVSGYVAQASIQTSILQELATAVRAGKYTSSFGKPESLVLVGHSFGSVISAAAITAAPALADGVILTGRR